MKTATEILIDRAVSIRAGINDLLDLWCSRNPIGPG